MPDKTEIRIGDFILSYCQIFVNISPKFYTRKTEGGKKKRADENMLRNFGRMGLFRKSAGMPFAVRKGWRDQA